MKSQDMLAIKGVVETNFQLCVRFNTDRFIVSAISSALSCLTWCSENPGKYLWKDFPEYYCKLIEAYDTAYAKLQVYRQEKGRAPCSMSDK